MLNFIITSTRGDAGTSRRRLLACAITTAPTASARGLVGVESREKRRQISDDVGKRHLDAVNALAALKAEPFEAVDFTGSARAFDNQPDGAGNRTLRRVAQMRRKQKDL